MRFSRAKESLAVLENAKEATIYDALNVFYDLCEDLRQENGAIDKLPAGNEGQMVRRMCWAGRTLLKIAEAHPDYIQNSEKSQNLERTFADILQEDKRLQQHFQELSKQLEQCKRDYEKKQLREGEISARLESIKDKADAMQKETQEKEDAYVSMTEAFDAQKGLYDQLIEQMQKLDGEHKKLVADTNALEEKLKIVNVEELREIYNQKARALEILQKNYDDLELQVKAQSEAAEQLKTEIAQHTKYLQEQAWNAEAEKQRVQNEKDALEERIAKANQDRMNLLNSVQAKEKELKELENWFNSLEAHNYSGRLQRCYQRTMALREAQDMLTNELQILGAISNDNAKDNLVAYQQYFRDAIKYIEKTLDEYQKNYMIVTEVFQQGGSSL